VHIDDGRGRPGGPAADSAPESAPDQAPDVPEPPHDVSAEATAPQTAADTAAAAAGLATEPTTGPTAEPVTESAFGPAEPIVEPAAEPGQQALPGPPARKPRRRGRTTLLIACAAVLGVLAGGGLGYRIQYDRKPTPLPPLTGAALPQPKGAAPPAPALPASEDGGLVFHKDLTKLLVPTPKGAHETRRGWESLLDYSEEYTDPSVIFTQLAGEHFQRSALAGWKQHDDYYTVILTQFRDETYDNARYFFSNESSGNDDDPESGPSVDIPGVDNGSVWPSAEPHRSAGYLPVYTGRGLAEYGNIFVEVYAQGLHPVKAATVMTVIRKQLERL
jgi:hypothetical protein